MQEEMNVCVDKAGEQRGVAELDDLRARRMRDRSADLLNALTGDEDFAWREDFSGLDDEQARGVQDGLAGCWLCRERSREQRCAADCDGRSA
jgi:hypothetical protein